MRHLKKFNEAFDSDILSSILSDIKNPESKKMLITQIINICNIYKYPASKLSSDMFEYTSAIKAFKIKPDEVKNYIWCYKFWFDINGELITTTGTNGKTLSKSTSTVGIHYSDFDSGSEAKMRLGDRWRSNPFTDGVIYKTHNCYYFIHNDENHRDGGTPDDDDWREYGSYSWSLGSGDHDSEAYSISNFNNNSDLNGDFKLNSFKDIMNVIPLELNDAVYCLVFYSYKFKNIEFETTTDIKTNRDLSKKGAIKLISDEEIRKINIDRYLLKMASKFNIEKLESIKGLILRISGGRNNTLINIAKSNIIDDTHKIYEKIFDLIKSSDISSDESSDKMDNLIKYIVACNKSFNERNSIINQNKKEVDEILNYSGSVYEKILNLKMNETSSDIYDMIKQQNFETLEDIYIFYGKLNTINMFINNSLSRLNRYFLRLSYTDHGRESANVIVDIFSRSVIEELISNLEYLSKIVKKM